MNWAELSRLISKSTRVVRFLPSGSVMPSCCPFGLLVERVTSTATATTRSSAAAAMATLGKRACVERKITPRGAALREVPLRSGSGGSAGALRLSAASGCPRRCLSISRLLGGPARAGGGGEVERTGLAELGTPGSPCNADFDCVSHDCNGGACL